LIIFIKDPKLSAVKTRLCPPLNPHQARKFYQAMCADIWMNLQRLNAIDLLAAVWPLPPGPILSWLKPLPRSFGQKGKDLGERMSHAFEHSFRLGSRATLIIGSDCPQLSTSILRKAFRLLENNDLVLGPATDGGYYLVGLKQNMPGL